MKKTLHTLRFSVDKMVIVFLNCLFRCHFLKGICIKEFKELPSNAFYSLWKFGVKYCFMHDFRLLQLSRKLDKLLYMFLEWIA